jgi:hypothetical protein
MQFSETVGHGRVTEQGGDMNVHGRSSFGPAVVTVIVRPEGLDTSWLLRTALLQGAAVFPQP